MATYKFEAEQRYGKYFAHLRKAADVKPNLTQEKPMASAEEVADFLIKQTEKLKLKEGADSIIWRNVAYEDFDSLADSVRRATY